MAEVPTPRPPFLHRLPAVLGALGRVLARPAPGAMHRRLRWTLLAVLGLVGTAVLLGQQQTEQLALQQRGHTEIVGLAGRQGQANQQIARLAALLHASSVDRRGTERTLQRTLHASQAEALRLDELLAAQSAASGEAARLLQPALLQWHSAQERLWYRAEVVLRLLGDAAEAPRLEAAIGTLQAEVESSLTATQTLIDRSTEAAQAHGREVIGTVRTSALFIAGLLVFLALGVAEPTVRAVQRQTRRLAAQAEELSRLALVAEHTHLAVLITDAKGRARWANQGFERITGFSSAAMAGLHPVRLLQPGRAAVEPLNTLRRAMAEGRGARAELPCRSREGRDHWLDLDMRPLTDAEGALTGFVLVANDITDRVTQGLKTAAIFATLPTGLVVRDAQGSVVECNPAASRMLALSPEQIANPASRPAHWKLQREDLSEYPMDDSPGLLALRSGEGQRGEIYGVATASGAMRWLLVDAEPITDAFGRAAGAVTCLTDVTESRQQRVLLETTVTAAGVGTWQWDMNSGKLSCNERFLTMLGYRPGELAADGIALGSLIHPDDVESRRIALRAHLGNPELPFRFEQRLRRPDGDWATVLSCGAVVERNASGRALRMAGIHLDLTEQMQMQAMLRHAARTDGLTQLPNRAAVFDRVQQALQRAGEQPGFGYAVLFMDFDRFKQVNDTLGHAVGDELLRQIAHRLRLTLRAGDTIGRNASHEHTAGRIGGDEFVVVLESVHSREEACLVARRLLDALAAPYQIGPHIVHSTASIGIVTSEVAANDAHTVMRDADTAMYEAKRGGRGRYVVFDPSMHERVAHGLALENDLRSALERDELCVVYQPVIELAGVPACTVEALARWRHPVRGIVSPADFIPVAEESGLIVELGRRVLQLACLQFAQWQRQLGPLAPSTLAVNLSTVQLRHPGLIHEVGECLRDSGLAPRQLQLEVTESLAAQDDLARERLRELKGLGVGIALDDFGTGYSSLACLHQLPVDTVKIDRSFVSQAETSGYHRALIEATIRVAQALGMTTVAEGIERTGQARLLQQLQCDRGQGFLYSRPLEAEALPGWLRTRAANAERNAA